MRVQPQPQQGLCDLSTRGVGMTRRASKRSTLKDKYKIERKIKAHKAKQTK